MALHVSFYKPVDYFSGVFNRFAAWWTAGQFCHCELVVETTPNEIMNAVKHIYTNAQNGKYAPEDCQRIITQIEMSFFDTHFRKMAQSSEQMTLSFSQIMGQKAGVRVLTKTAHDTWFKIPSDDDENIAMLPTYEISPEKIQDTLTFAIESLGKNYDTTGALCSWLPFGTNEHRKSYECYFCSEFVVTAFQRIGFMDSLDAKRTTPNSLHGYLMKS